MAAFVKVGEEETIESAVARFKKAQEEEGVLKEWRKHEFFIKPSLKKHQAKIKARRKNKK